MNVYPSQMKAVLAYIEALDTVEAKLDVDLPYPREVRLTDNDGTDWGTLRDEVGGSWSWYPAGVGS